MKEYKILSMDKAVIRKNSNRTEYLCNQLLSKPGTKLRLEAIQNVTMLHRAEKVAARVFAEHKRPNGARSMPDYVGRDPDARARFGTRSTSWIRINHLKVSHEQLLVSTSMSNQVWGRKSKTGGMAFKPSAIFSATQTATPSTQAFGQDLRLTV